jgi:hypothetical protein
MSTRDDSKQIIKILKRVRALVLEDESTADEALTALVLVGKAWGVPYRQARPYLEIHDAAVGPALAEARSDRNWFDVFWHPGPG